MALTLVTLANERHKQSGASIVVRNLGEFTGALKQLDADAAKELRLSFKDIARYVAGVAEGKMPTGPAPLHANKSALRVGATQKGATIGFPAGGADSRDDPLGYYPWLDFGGTVGRGRVSAGFTLTQSKAGVWRAHASHQKAIVAGARGRSAPKGGNYLYPAIAESSDKIADEVYKAIGRAARSSQFETKGL